MSPATSVYLDLARFLAAVVVFLSHAAEPRFTSGALAPFHYLGSDAVMAFFVLSGFVIAHVSATKEHRFTDFAIARLARLYSVALPALVLTVVVDTIGVHVDPDMYQPAWFHADRPVQRLVACLFFLNEIWFRSVWPLSNGPYWSLGYEFWYYALFAVGFYCTGRMRWWLLGAIALFIGPKILLLLPVWGFGVLAWHASKRVRWPLALAVTVFAVSMILILLIRGLHLLAPAEIALSNALGLELYERKLGWSGECLRSYVLGGFFAINIVALAALSARLERLAHGVGPVIRYAAGFTFALYLFHYPLLHFFGAMIHNDPTSVFDQFFVIGATLVAVWLLGFVSERRKEVYRRGFEALSRRWIPGR